MSPPSQSQGGVSGGGVSGGGASVVSHVPSLSLSLPVSVSGGSSVSSNSHPGSFSASKLLLDDLFMQWLALPASRTRILELLELASAGKLAVGSGGASLATSGTLSSVGSVASGGGGGAVNVAEQQHQNLENSSSVANGADEAGNLGSAQIGITPAQAAAAASTGGAPLSPPKAPTSMTQQTNAAASVAASSPKNSNNSPVASSPSKTLMRRGSHANIIPTFFFGNKNDDASVNERTAEASTELTAALGRLTNKGTLTPDGFMEALRTLAGLPVYFAPCLARQLVGNKAKVSGGDDVPLAVACTGVSEEALKKWWLGDGRATKGACHATVVNRAFDILLNGGVEPRGDAEGATTTLGRFYSSKPNAATGATLTPDHFRRMLHTFANHHPGLEFLQPSRDFQLRYIDTVAIRMFYHNNQRGNMRMTRAEFSKSDIVDVLVHACDTEPDVNRILRYLSYEHFYVVYCKFWELDGDRDFVLSFDDVLRYNGHALTSRCIERIVAGCGRPNAPHVAMRRKLRHESTPKASREAMLAELSAADRSIVKGDLMTYEDFTYFLLSEEDKTSDVALQYWHRVLDVDDDGVLSARDMWHFYEEQLSRMECLSQEPVGFEDILCQILDMVPGRYPFAFSERGSGMQNRPTPDADDGDDAADPTAGAPKVIWDAKEELPVGESLGGGPIGGVLLTLRILKSHRRLASHVLDALINWGKFTLYECRDPQLVRLERECSMGGFTDWDRFARFEYSRLSAEEEEEEAAAAAAAAASG
ncbi:EF-hand domain-containing protein [Pseudoscourfieldia marina]